MCILYIVIIRTRHRQSKLRSIFFERANERARLCVCVCAFVSSTSFHFIGITFLGKSMLNLMENGYGCLFVCFCLFHALSARSLQNSVYSEELKSESWLERADK